MEPFIHASNCLEHLLKWLVPIQSLCSTSRTCNSAGTIGSGDSVRMTRMRRFDPLWGLPAEFNQAREFLDKVAGHLKLGHDRVVIVPGNHDINRKSCESYFNGCDADGEKPKQPFWPKWKQYAHSFEEFYRALAPRFTVNEPWTWYEIPELKLVVAGLNSTISEIHGIPETDPRHVELIRPWTS